MAYTTIDDPSAHFQTMIYTGDGNDDRALTNDGNSNLKPDLVWIKERNSTSAHQLIDSTRGGGLALSSHDTGTDESFAYIDTFDTDGFTLETSDGSTNEDGNTFVAWQWKANGGTTASNSNGSLASTVQANTTSRFSIVTYTGTGSSTTVGHGLGVIPHLVIVKNRSASQHWRVFHKDAYTGGGYGQYQSGIKLNETSVADHGANSYWDNNAFTTSTFSIGTNAEVNVSSENFVAYCFAEIQGYSKFGTYEGNGNADGPFVYLGFKPAMLIYKRTDSTANWSIFDNKRSVYNQISHQLNPNISNAEGDSNRGDFVSNGWKIRATAGSTNASGGTYIYMAFAESPFVTSSGVPATAR